MRVGISTFTCVIALENGLSRRYIDNNDDDVCVCIIHSLSPIPNCSPRSYITYIIAKICLFSPWESEREANDRITRNFLLITTILAANRAWRRRRRRGVIALLAHCLRTNRTRWKKKNREKLSTGGSYIHTALTYTYAMMRFVSRAHLLSLCRETRSSYNCADTSELNINEDG